MKQFSPFAKTLALLAAVAAFSLLPFIAHADDDMKMKMSGDKMDKMGNMGMAKSGSEITVSGEVLDMACYLDHGASGEKHADCAKMCISSGLPVGLKTADGTVYLLIGQHKPINEMLADKAAQTVKVKGKFVSRDGINLIENTELVQ